MKEYLEYHDEKSHKYWEIFITGNKVTVHYGRINTTGQTKEKIFESEEIALKTAKQLINSKLKKGYKRVSYNNQPITKTDDKKDQEESKKSKIESELKISVPGKIEAQYSEHGKLDGTCIFYRKDYILKTEWNNGLLHGKLTYENKKHQLIEQNIKNGKPLGQSSYWSKNGELLYKNTYENGIFVKSHHYKNDALYKTCYWNKGSLGKIENNTDMTPYKEDYSYKIFSPGDPVRLREPEIKHNPDGKILSIEYWQKNKFNLNPGKYKKIESLSFHNCYIKDITKFLEGIKDLKKLYLRNVALEFLPENINKHPNLEEIILSNCPIVGLPECICNLTSLKKLQITLCPIISLLENLGNLQSLETLIVSDSQIEEIPNSIGSCKNLVKIECDTKQPGDWNYKPKPIEWGMVRELPESLGQCEKLSQILIHNQMIFKVPSGIQKIKSLSTLKVDNCFIMDLPSLKSLPKLSNINFSNNVIRKFPDINVLQRIGIFLSDNIIKSIPGYITKISSCSIEIKNNPIEHLDDSILNLTKGNLYRDLRKYIKKLKVEQGIKIDDGPEIYTLRCESKEEIKAKLPDDPRTEIALKITNPLFKLNSNSAGMGSEAEYDFEIVFPRESDSYNYGKLLIDLEVVKPISKKELLKLWSEKKEPDASKEETVSSFLKKLEQNSVEQRYYLVEFLFTDNAYNRFGMIIVKLDNDEYLGFMPDLYLEKVTVNNYLLKLPQFENSVKASELLRMIQDDLKTICPYAFDFDDYLETTLIIHAFSKSETMVIEKLFENAYLLKCYSYDGLSEEFQHIDDIILNECKNHRHFYCGNGLYVQGIFFEIKENMTLGIVTRTLDNP